MLQTLCRPVLTLVGHLGGEGKNFLLAPLRKVFGLAHAQATPEPGTFPLLGLERKSVALLDEWTVNAQVLPLTTQPLWFEGKPFLVSHPQNLAEHSGLLLCQGSAPIYVTCKEKDFKPISDQAGTDRREGGVGEHSASPAPVRVLALQALASSTLPGARARVRSVLRTDGLAPRPRVRDACACGLLLAPLAAQQEWRWARSICI